MLPYGPLRFPDALTGLPGSKKSLSLVSTEMGSSLLANWPAFLSLLGERAVGVT